MNAFLQFLASLFGRKTTSAPSAPKVTSKPVTKPAGGSRLKRSGVLMAGAVALVAAWEGVRTTAYLDTIASPPVWTVCAGETRGVKRGDRYTRVECEAMLEAGLVEFETQMRRCLTAPDALPDGMYTAFLSVSWNIGTNGFCGSSMARRANAGDLVGACDALLMWNKAGGRVVRGLVNRRADEHRICRASL